MLHYFENPQHIAAGEMSVLNQLPKLNDGPLEANRQNTMAVWDLCYERGWNVDLLIMATAGVMTIGSLFFGICWTLVKADIRGA